MTGWRRSPIVALAVIAVFTVIQLAIPISQIGGPQATDRFAWQMFSTFIPDPGFVVVTESGESEVVISEHMARVRWDIAIAEVLPDHLCRTVPGAVRVVWDEGSRDC